MRAAEAGPWAPEVAAAIRRVELCGVIDDVAYLAEECAAFIIQRIVLGLHDDFHFPLNTQKLFVEGQPAQDITIFFNA
jgi:hypothetical protein